MTTISSITTITLGELDWTLNGLKSGTPFSQETDSDINLLISFYQTYLMPKYQHCIFYQMWDEVFAESTYKYEATLKLYSWYKKHIDAMKDITAWYESNKASLLNNEIKSTTKTKASDTPQDGEDYTDTYPTAQTNVESTAQVRDNVSFLNSLAKKYHNYMSDFADNFVRECGVYYDREV